MYLTDHEISALANQLQIEGPNPEHPFEPPRQIQPCSIDLRVSDVFWKPLRRRQLWRKLMPWREITIDLGRSSMHELDPLRDWKRFVVKEGQFITIKPGHTVMARVYERFRMPIDCAGKIEGRSSFARLGLAIHCTGDFINPGWEGFMLFDIAWFVLLGCLLVSVIPALLSYERHDDGYLGTRELRARLPPHEAS